MKQCSAGEQGAWTRRGRECGSARRRKEVSCFGCRIACLRVLQIVHCCSEAPLGRSDLSAFAEFGRRSSRRRRKQQFYIVTRSSFNTLHSPPQRPTPPPHPGQQDPPRLALGLGSFILQCPDIIQEGGPELGVLRRELRRRGVASERGEREEEKALSEGGGGGGELARGREEEVELPESTTRSRSVTGR